MTRVTVITLLLVSGLYTPNSDLWKRHFQFLCQLTSQSADIVSSLCGVGVRVNNFFSKTTRPRDMLFFLKDTLSIEDEKCSRHANLSVRLFARDITRGVPPPKV